MKHAINEKASSGFIYYSGSECPTFGKEKKKKFKLKINHVNAKRHD